MPTPSFRAVVRHGTRQAASTLAATMLVVLAIATFLSLAAYTTSQFGRLAGRQQGISDQFAACDAAMEYAFAQWKATVRKINTTTGNPPAFSASGLDKATFQTKYNTLTGGNYTFTSMVITAVNQNGLNSASVPPAAETSPTGLPPQITTKTVLGYPGWTGYTFNYKITVGVTNAHYGISEPQFIQASRYFQVTRVPLFQAAIFYENKLEIHPGSAMTVTGPVHTNGDLWAQGFDVLRFNSNVSFVGAFHGDADSTVTQGWDGYGYKMFPADSQKVTWSDGKTTGASTTGLMGSQLNQVSPIDPFGGASTNNNGLHDIVEVPPIGSTDNQIAYNNAALRIVTNSATGITVMTYGDGTPLSSADATAVTAALTSVPRTTIYDQREAGNVTLTSLDMAKLATATTLPNGNGNNGNGNGNGNNGKNGNPTQLQTLFNANGHAGTVYIHDISPAGKSAIRLVNGRDLGENVSIATDNGVYIQGDYNTGGADPSKVPSNQSNPDGNAIPQAPDYNLVGGVSTRYSSSVMADAVTVLSNNWQDSNSSKSLYNRTATATTVNTAILAGDVPSNYYPGVASGGAHNFPRFLENWQNTNFTYWGSLVEAYRSETFKGMWQTGNVYYWPERKWNFDTNFLVNPPPGAPQGLQFSRGRWERTFQ